MLAHTRSPARLAPLVLLLEANSCWAGTSAPFDVGALVLWAGAYLVGLVLLLVGSTQSKNFLIALAIYIGVPVAWLTVDVAVKNRRNAQILSETETGERTNQQAFSQYCKARQRRLVSTVSIPASAAQSEATVSVRIDKAFTGLREHFNAGQIAIALQRKPASCHQTGLKFIEGQYDGTFIPNQGYAKEFRRYDACDKSKSQVIEGVNARYELVLGETGTKQPTPWGGDGGRWMSRTSVRIINRESGSLLAEDTMYFLRYETGIAGCPDGGEQISELISSVFANPPERQPFNR